MNSVKEKTLIVAGGRDEDITDAHYIILERVVNLLYPVVIIEGGQRGIDTFARNWAKLKHIHKGTFEADWDRHGKAAGPIRNRQMAKVADAVLLFNGGIGTRRMRQIAREEGLVVIEAGI